MASFAGAGAARAETRTLKIMFVHTGEKATVTYKRNGQYIQSGLNQLNKIVQDFRRKESTKMDPRLYDLLWEVYQRTGSREYINVISGYRSPATNSMLRSRSNGVAKNSQHTLGKAMDFFIPGVKLSTLREAGLKAGYGGVGFYPSSGSPFVHLDVGSVRHWPRMSRQELVRLFPDGKTLHVPSDGKPLPRYEQALAEYKSKGRASSVTVASVEETKKPNFFQMLAARAKQDQEDDEGEEAPTAVVTAGREPSEIKVAAVEKPAEARAASTSSAPATVEIAAAPVPEERPAEIAALASRDDPFATDRVPMPIRRPELAPLVAAAPEPAPAETVAVAALSPSEIEEIRKIAVPGRPEPASAGIALPRIATAGIPAPRPAAAVPGVAPFETAAADQADGPGSPRPLSRESGAQELALLSEPATRSFGAPPAASLAAERLVSGMPLPAPAPRPGPQDPVAVSPASGQERVPAQGPSRRTLELALAAAPPSGSRASRAIRDLVAAVGGGEDRQVPGSLGTSFEAGSGALVAAVPVPTRDPRKTAPVLVAAAPQAPTDERPAAKIAQVEPAKKVAAGRYALAADKGVEKAVEMSAPGYALAPSVDAQTLVVAGFVQARLQAPRRFDFNATPPGIRFERR